MEDQELRKFAEYIGELIHAAGYSTCMAIQSDNGAIIHCCSDITSHTFSELCKEFIGNNKEEINLN